VNVVVPDQALLRMAGDIAETHAIPAGAALNLAAVHKIREQIGSVAMRFIGHRRMAELVSKLALATTD
jgi:hypothetical protein